MHQYSAKMKVLNKYMPSVKGVFFVGSVSEFLAHTPWDLMESWHKDLGPIYSFGLMGRTCVSVADPSTLKVMLQTKHSSFKKDLPFTYKPFMNILGKGIVTSDGKEWRRQRTRISKVLRIDVLDEIPGITVKALARLVDEIEGREEDEGGGKVVEIGELLRHLALQVICEALLR